MKEPNVYIEDRMSLFAGASPVVTVRADGFTREARLVVHDCLRKLSHGELSLSDLTDTVDRNTHAFRITASMIVMQSLCSALNEWIEQTASSPQAERSRFPLHDEIALYNEQLQLSIRGEIKSREYFPRKLQCKDFTLNLGERTLIMGILNVTPDSFSDGGNYFDADASVRRAKQMVEEGADIIDIGGESTRPGAEKVPLEIELERVIPVVSAVRSAVDIPISVDTYKAEVARRALEAGAHIVNDQWRLLADRDMAATVARFGCPVILMHNREQQMGDHLLGEIVADLRQSIRIAQQAGIADQQIIVDPGIGFAKSYDQNLQTMNLLKSVSLMGYPILLGTSRKSMIRLTLQLSPHEVIEGTAATAAYGIAQGCHIMRVHDVKEIKKTAVMMDAMLRWTR